jgi:UDP-N-acetylglucosamine diphosphorylase / glucose-1-phosphate thymidylyltransferase / UDP-N-acetylgalactosamine diphosphorylase / glucosamine-1-phosphate N-acetyltransferase / galactosamine-1-phosphate N-acetyltransferase
MSIALFDDSHWQNFAPISLTKATFDMKVGAKSFFEEHVLAPETLLTREYLATVTAERHAQCNVNPTSIDSDTVFINGLLHPAAIHPDRLLKISHTFAITTSSNNRLLVARLDSKGIEYLQDRVAAGKTIDVKKLKVEKSTKLEDHQTQGILSEPWDIIRVLENSLAIQVSTMKNEAELAEGVRVDGTNTVALGRGATVEVGTLLDVRNGGIYIGPGAYVATSRIIGPAYIGDMTQVKQFTIIEASYIGYNCRVAGEVEHSIISDYANKAHAGFIGHSYVGEWVNIGAMTTTSDLKMTYGNIKMNSGKKKVDTGQNKIGSFFADMVKTSIGTLIYSGRRIGVSSHLHGLVAQDVPSFTIYGTSIGVRNVELELDSIIETQSKMMRRRNQMMSKAYEQMIKDVFATTAADRKLRGVRKGKFAF